MYLIVFISANLPFNAYAQYVSASVFNGFGHSITVSNQTFDVSIGEMASSTFESGGYFITQGFLQPISLKVPCNNVQLRAFPNPVIAELSIIAEGCDLQIANVKTYDLFGKLVYEGRPINNQLNLSNVGVGVYLVRAYNINNEVVGVVKIMKATI